MGQVGDTIKKWGTNGWKVISSNTIYVHHACSAAASSSHEWWREQGFYMTHGGVKEGMNTFIIFGKE